MKLSLLKQIHHFPEFFKLCTSLWWKILPLTGLWEKHTNPALSSKTCWSHAILLLSNAGHVLIAPYTPKWNGHGSHRILHCYHKRLQLFREFLRLCIQNRCTVALPIHKWFQDLPWFLISTRPAQHGSIHLAYLTVSSSPPLTALQVASKMPRFREEICHSKAGWLELNRKKGTFSKLVPSMWQGDRLSKDSVSKIWGCLTKLDDVLPCSQNGAPENTWSNVWIHPWKLTAGYIQWWFSSQFSISFQIWYRTVKFLGCNHLWILSQGLLMRLLGQLRGRGTWL